MRAIVNASSIWGSRLLGTSRTAPDGDKCETKCSERLELRATTANARQLLGTDRIVRGAGKCEADRSMQGELVDAIGYSRTARRL